MESSVAITSHETSARNDKITASPAVTTVLATSELLENILSNLPLKDLVRAEQVNTDFANVVERSKTLKTTLFLQPGDYEVPNQDENPFHPDFFLWYLVPPGHKTIVKSGPRLEKPNPLLQAAGWSPNTRFWYQPFGQDWVSDLDWDFVECLLGTKGQSWEMMFVTQPSTYAVFVEILQVLPFDDVRRFRRRWKGHDCLNVRKPGGVRMGEVVDAIQAMLKGARLTKKSSDGYEDTRLVITISIHDD